MKRISLLGSTGSIGTQTLEVIDARRDQFDVVALSAGGSNPRLLAEQAVDFDVELVAVADESKVDAVRKELGKLGASAEVIAGAEAVEAAAGHSVDVVVNAVTGAAGLTATLSALKSGATLALANKESLVIGGELVTGAASPGQIVAVDSEHSAIAQALRAGRRAEVARVILTASGGPFRGRSRAELDDVTVGEAMQHPTWAMGQVITINSATLVNKGLELIEAALLYDLDFDQITAVVHPQSVIHSAVEFVDGSTIAQCSPPDMKLPIALALSWPERMPGASRPCDWTQSTSWTFEPLDSDTFPAVELAREVGRAGGVFPAIYNAANEACVDAFVGGEIPFLAIVDTIADVVEAAKSHSHGPLTLESVLAADAWARSFAEELIISGGAR